MMVANSQNLIITVRPANQEVGIALPQEEPNYGSIPTSSRSSARYSPATSIQQSTENLSIEANEITQEAATNNDGEELNTNLPSSNEDLPSNNNHQLPSETNLQHDASEYQSAHYDDYQVQDQTNHALQHDEVATKDDDGNSNSEYLHNDEYNNHYEEHEEYENYYDVEDDNEINQHQQVADQYNHSEAPETNNDHPDSDDYSGDEV